jgi:ATP-dependent RNA helicase RhlE
MDLEPRLLKVLEKKGFEEPTPIQEQLIPVALEGRDAIGTAQTGTGKTFAYILPAFSRLAEQRIEKNSMLVLTPTRELAGQVFSVAEEFGKAVGIRSTSVYGGVSMQPQIDALRRGCSMIVATPGRLLDHMSRGNVNFKDLQILVLDEADRMLDMGFLPDIMRIVRRLPQKRQTILCSATWPDEVARLARDLQKDAERIAVGAISKPVEKVRQVLYPIFPEDKLKLLLHLLESDDIHACIIFLRTRARTERVYKALRNHKYNVACIHGDRSQRHRQQALEGFRDGKYDLLVATDVAARGLDIDGISHVINYDIPQNPDDYIHRIGRTARADADGDAVTFVCPQEHEPLCNIERALGKNLPRGEWERIAPVLSTHKVAGTGTKRKRGASRRPRRLLRRR